MQYAHILKRVDHTLLKVTATWDEIKQLADAAIEYGTATICIPPCYVHNAKKYVDDRMKICTVIGFPNGYNTSKIKAVEAQQAIDDGADEIDMVVNLGLLKNHQYSEVLEDILEVKSVCGDRVLKVIIETSYLSRAEKIDMCKVVTESGAQYIKTSTGFAPGGATFEDVNLLRDNIGENVKIKAAGGISSLQDAEEFISLGASRLGTSRIVKLVKELGF